MTRKDIAREIDFVDSFMQSHFYDYGEETHRALQEAIKALEQEPTTGHWIVDDFTGLIKCDVCGNDAYMDTTSGEQCKSKYCPNCGCRMSEVSE